MASEYSKEERVLLEEIGVSFDDALTLSKNVSIYKTDQEMMASTGDVIWRPMPYIAQSFDGTDMTANFKESTQLSVPATISYQKSSPWIMTSEEARIAVREKLLGDAAKQKLASDINASVMVTAAYQSTLVVKRTVAASGFDDVALCDAIMNEQGVQGYERYLSLTTRDYNSMASNLASRATMTGKPENAYERSYVGDVASFMTFKLDYAQRLAAAAGGGALTIGTRVADANYYTPISTSTATTGETSNVDNRYQTVTISSTTNVAAGDCFTIAGVNAVHHITKGDTGQLKTFRVISVDSATTMTISPPIISGQGGTDAELAYQNCVVNTTSATSAIVFLNTAAAGVNCFWQKDSVELLPGRYAVPSNSGASIMRMTTEQGIELVMQKFYDINTMKIKYRIDTLYGVCMKQPEMCGIMLFNQT